MEFVKVHSRENKIPYEEVISLRQKGVLNLGIDPLLATKIMIESGKYLGKLKTIILFNLMSWIIWIGFGFTIYMAFTREWWWILIGLVGSSITWNLIKRNNAFVIIDLGMKNVEFYNAVLDIEGWMYEIKNDST